MLTRKGILLTWPTLIVGSLLVGVLAFAVVRAQRVETPTLTAEDRLEIQELLHRYMFVLDSCPDHNSGYDYADLYTEDGQFTCAVHARTAGTAVRSLVVVDHRDG